MKTLFKLAVLLLFIQAGCKKTGGDPSDPGKEKMGFEKTPQKIPVSEGIIPEASGIADSKKNPGYLWVEEDSGNPARLFLLSHDGTVQKTIDLKDAENRDWEDIVLGAGPDSNKDYLYIAETGDNDQEQSTYAYYRLEEPAMSVSEVTVYDKINFKYPDGSHDSEAFLVDGKTKDIYIITKRDDKSRVYKLTYPQSTTDLNEATFVATLPYTGVVSAALSQDGTEIIVKTYLALNYYTRNSSESIGDALQKTYRPLDYQLEAQGEGVCFSVDDTGFYTFSEEANDIIPTLNFYKRK